MTVQERLKLLLGVLYYVLLKRSCSVCTYSHCFKDTCKGSNVGHWSSHDWNGSQPSTKAHHQPHTAEQGEVGGQLTLRSSPCPLNLLSPSCPPLRRTWDQCLQALERNTVGRQRPKLLVRSIVFRHRFWAHLSAKPEQHESGADTKWPSGSVQLASTLRAGLWTWLDH